MNITDDLEIRDLDIAVIGMELKVPGAENTEEFWENLCKGKESLRFFSDEELLEAGVSKEELEHENYRNCAFDLDGIKNFDAPFFGFTLKEAVFMDPQQRMMLQSAWKLMESAGYTTDEYDGEVGVFVGTGTSKYLLKNIMNHYDLDKSKDIRQIWMGNDVSYASTNISYALNLKGPSVNVHTACSTSLTSVVLACQSLLNYQCDMAIAGGCSISLPQQVGYMYQEGEVLSKDGHCRPFDKDGTGTLESSGVTLVMLKRLEDALEDADNVIAVIKGYSYNNDGNAKVGFTAPSVEGERNAIKRAQILSEIDEETITYVETHGTATPLGDPIEIQALTEAFREGTDKKNFCALGSVKANIGHLDCAAGTASMIKACLMLQNKKLVPLINFNEPNSAIDFENSPFYINKELNDWYPDCGVRRSGVSSFGIGGTNVHLILEEAINQKKVFSNKKEHLLTWSAKTKGSFDRIKNQLIEYLESNQTEDFRNLLYTMNIGRKKMRYRNSLVCENENDLIFKLKNSMYSLKTDKNNEEDIVFMFPGQGSQYTNMAQGLYEQFTVFRTEMNRCMKILEEQYNYDLKQLLMNDHPDDSTVLINETAHTHATMFVVEYCTAKLLIHLGIQPKVILGHSIGEYAGACIAGVFSLEDALKIIVARGQIIQKLPRGHMLYVNAAEKEVLEYLSSEVSLALINTDKRVVLSGEKSAIEAVKDRIGNKYNCKILHTSHAFHSSMLKDAIEPLRKVLSSVFMHEPSIRFMSNTTGKFVTGTELQTVDYWINHMMDTVNFRDEVLTLKEENFRHYIEIGPGRTLSLFVKENLYDSEDIVTLNVIKDHNDKISDGQFFEEFLGKAWMNGLPLNWTAYYDEEKLYRISAPTYPFEERELWIEGGINKTAKAKENDFPVWEESTVVEEIYNRPDLSSKYEAPTNSIEENLVDILTELMGIYPMGIDDNFFELGGHSLLATQLIVRVKETFDIDLNLGQITEAATIRQMSELVIDEFSELLDNIEK